MQLRTDPSRLRGSIAPLFTPFTEDGAVDHDSLRTMVRWQIANGSSGVSIGGSTGEPGAQSRAERAAAIRTVAAETAGRIAFLPGTGSASLPETLELTGIARDAGADAVLVVTPYYARPTQQALYIWYSTVALEFPELPIIAYNVPARTAVDLAPETFARLFREHDNIVGIKETTRDFEHFSRVRHLCGPEVLMWSGIELLCLPLIAIGGTGFLSALANIAPAALAQTFAAADAGDWERARELHYGVHPLVDLLFVETNPAPAKWLMAQRGLIRSAQVRPPLIPLTEQGRTRVLALAEQGGQYLTPVPERSLS